MNDCPNADVRDLLPDLLHDRLDEPTRAMVESHLEGCADCRAELALLRDVRSALRRTPAVDIASIMAAVPSYRAPARRSWVGWRTAAAITLLVAGGSSVVVMQGNRQPRSAATSAIEMPSAQTQAPPAAPIESATVTIVPSIQKPSVPVAQTQTPTSTEVPVEPTQAPRGRELAMGGGSLTDLSDRELAALLKDIDSLDALPSTDVESVPISPIGPRRSTP